MNLLSWIKRLVGSHDHKNPRILGKKRDAEEVVKNLQKADQALLGPGWHRQASKLIDVWKNSDDEESTPNKVECYRCSSMVPEDAAKMVSAVDISRPEPHVEKIMVCSRCGPGGS